MRDETNGLLLWKVGKPEEEYSTDSGRIVLSESSDDLDSLFGSLPNEDVISHRFIGFQKV